jgi:hypothetical protein
MCLDRSILGFQGTLDKCPLDDNSRSKVLVQSKDISKSVSVQILVTSRPELDIKVAFEEFVRYNIH